MELTEILQQSTDPEGMTITELLTAMGMKVTAASRNTLRDRLRDEIAAGRAIHAGDKRIKRIDGRMTPVPVYRAV